MWGRNELGVKRLGGETSSGGETTRGETTRGGGRRLGGETTRGGNGLGAKRLGFTWTNRSLAGGKLFFSPISRSKFVVKCVANIRSI